MYQSLGERLNYFSSFCIQFFKKCLKCRKKEVSQTEMVTTTGVLALVVILGGAAMFKSYEKWNYFDSIYYCIITLTTIGFGDYVVKILRKKLKKLNKLISIFVIFHQSLKQKAMQVSLLIN